MRQPAAGTLGHAAAVHNCLARAHLPAHVFGLQGGSEKLGDEDLELVLDKLVRLLAYISGGWGVSGLLRVQPARPVPVDGD